MHETIRVAPRQSAGSEADQSDPESRRAGKGWPHGFRLFRGAIPEYLLLLALVAAFLWRGFIPGWRALNTDFPNYYLAARLYRQGYPLDRLYDWVWFQRQADHAGLKEALVSFVPLTPFSLLPLLPFSSLPALSAKHYWMLLNLLLLTLTACLLRNMTAMGFRRVAILVFFAVLPLRTNFLYGQEHVLMLFLLTLAAWCYLRGSRLTSGVLLAVGAALKVYPALFLFYFVLKKRWRATIGLLAGSLTLGFLSLLLFRLGTVRAYVVEVLPRPLRGDSMDPYNVGLNSYTALLHRLFIAEPELNPHPLVHFPAAYAFLQPVCQALLLVSLLWFIGLWHAEPARERLEWASYVVLLLILSSNPASYHYCVLILAGVLGTNYLLEAGRIRQAAVLAILYALACLPLDRFSPKSPSGWHTLLAFPRLYALTGLWALLRWALADSAPRTLAARLKSAEAVVFGGIFMALVAAGTWSNLLYLKGQFANYASRIVVTPDSIMALEPATANNRVAFTTLALDAHRYVIGNLSRESLSFLQFDLDAFHPSLAASAPDGWVELASSSSRVVRLSLGSLSTQRHTAEQFSVEAEGAEAPAVSADGQWLAFIRESEGRGSLWVKNLRGPGGEEAERKLVNDTSDVRDVAFFPDGRVAFAAQPGSVPHIFVADPASQRILRLTADNRRARFPAVSPDGQWLAFSQQDGGSWQVSVMKLSTGEEHPLTNADCNSTTPAWLPDSHTLVYATDCGRGLGLSALCKIRALP